MRTTLLITLALCGCGMGARDVADYEARLDGLEASVAAHESAITTATSATDCSGEHARYDATAREQLSRLRGMAGGMDMHRGFGLGGMCSSMMGELDVHATQACGGDATANFAETARHCHAMRDWLCQQRARLGTPCTR